MAAEVSAPDRNLPRNRRKTSASQHTGDTSFGDRGQSTGGDYACPSGFALYCYYSVQQLKHWITPSWDLAIFTQMAQAYSHFDMPIVQIKGTDF